MTDGKTKPDEKQDISLSDFIRQVPEGTTIVGLDLGDKTIGVAVADTMRISATPLKTIRRKSFFEDMKELESLLEGRVIGGFVSGLPKQMNGEEGERAEITRKFAWKIACRFKKPLYFQDERLSSVAVERVFIRDLNMSRKKRKQNIDCGAAAYILQGVLDALRF